MSARVTKSENFPDSVIFVAKTFRIKRVNRANFQIRDKCAWKVVLQDFVHKQGPNMLHTVLDHANSLQIIRTSLGSSGNFPDPPGTFLDHPDSF